MRNIVIIGLLVLLLPFGLGKFFGAKKTASPKTTSPPATQQSPQPASVTAPFTATGTGFLKVKGAGFVDGNGNAVVLKGFNLGGWLMYEDWLFESTFANLAGGQTENELTITANLDKVYGAGAGKKFFTGIRDNFVTEADITAIAALGANVVRVPVPYWLVDDGSAFTYIDRVLVWGAAHGVRAIIDLHAVPGCQLPAPFCTTTKTADLWGNAANESRTLDIWKKIATRYTNNATVAGYDLLGEPAKVSDADLEAFYKKLIAAVRGVDKSHILFIEANGWALDSRVFRDKWLLSADVNAAYSLHMYKDTACPPLANYSTDIDKFLTDQWNPIAGHNRPLYIGEYGGSCGSWVTAATGVFAKRNIAATTYFTWKGLRPAGAESKVANDIVDRAPWNTILSKLGKGAKVSDTELSAAFASLRWSNFTAKSAYESALKAYFAK